MNIALIAALSTNNIIGRDGQLPWHLPQDLAYFQSLTLHKAIVMGRKTYESIGKPLPHRRNIVLSRQELNLPAGVKLAHHMPEACLHAHGAPALCIIGGAEIYRYAWPWVTDLYLTRVHATIEGDATFPAWDPSHWQLTHRSEDHTHDAWQYHFEHWRRS